LFPILPSYLVLFTFCDRVTDLLVSVTSISAGTGGKVERVVGNLGGEWQRGEWGIGEEKGRVGAKERVRWVTRNESRTRNGEGREGIGEVKG
jgi:hypothetical protein